MVQWLRLSTPGARGLGSIPSQGTRSYMLQLKILYASMKTWHSQINKYFLKRPRSESESCSVVSYSLLPHGLYSPYGLNSPGQNTGGDSLSLLQGIFPTEVLNPGLPHCRWILYQLTHKRSPTILEWVAYPFSSGSSQARN